MTQKKYFGTDGMRGRVGGSVINSIMMTKLGRAVGVVLKEESRVKPHVVIGCDTRISCKELQLALQTGLLSTGVDVSLLDVLPTPAIAYFTKKLNASAGVVISASHNPYEDNGVKLIGQNGLKLSDKWEQRIEEKMELPLSDVSVGKVDVILDAVSQYVLHATTLFSDVTLNAYKIILDCANGATYHCAPKIFSDLGAEITVIHAEPNGININDRCGATAVENLRERVWATKADCGLAFDGDGDRLMMIDHKGEVVDGDEILCILAVHESKKHPAVVGTLMSNLGLEKALKTHQIQFERVSVGDRYVLEKLQENKWRLGGEGSGHIINLDYGTTGDGIMSALQVLRIMQQTQKSLYELKQVMFKRPQILINIPVKNPNEFSTMQEITDAVAAAKAILKDSGRILLRASGTESCVRVMVECDDETQARELAGSLAKVVEQRFVENHLKIN
ncbi:MAG: phosphoglucosamine mutase [Gammaproteobacteria bacterium RIFCSPHIGHO2_12_FULL_38_11]|nr:MAG: phosphoglucosamine mutase [Gammaproteobacteria bacterium RIFCSPHIGHO2_12_FULL_38_11]